MKLFKSLKTKISNYLFKKFIKTPIVQEIYEVPPDGILGKIIGTKHNVPRRLADIRQACVDAIIKFIELQIPNEAGKNYPALTLVVHPDTYKELQLLPHPDYSFLPFLDWLFHNFNFKQMIVDKRLYANEICIEDYTNISDKVLYISLLKDKPDITYEENWGIHRYCIYLK